MAIDLKKRGPRKINFPLLVLSGGILTILSLIFFVKTLHSVYGVFGLDFLSPSNITFAKKDKVAIVYSKYSMKYIKNGVQWMDDNVNAWIKYLEFNKINPDIIFDKDIEEGKLSKYKLVIFPGVKSMSDIELTEVKKYVENGGSIFATGGISTLNEKGEWRGWQFCMDVFGVNFSKEISSKETTAKIHTIRGGTAISAGVPAGFPLKIATWNIPICFEVMEPRTIQASSWYNYRYEEGLVDEGIKKSAGIIYGTYGTGRFIWMGFEINSVIGEKEDFAAFEKIVRNSVNWLTYKPIAYIQDWPENYEAASVFTVNLNEEIHNAYNLIDILKANNLPATFFIDKDALQANLDIVNNLKQYGQIVPIVDIGYVKNNRTKKFEPYSFEKQYGILKSTKEYFESAIQQPIKGIIIKNGIYNSRTLEALYKLNMKFLLTDSLTDRSVPLANYFEETPIIVFTKTARDDYDIINNYKLTDPQFQIYTYEEDIDRIAFESGLYVLKVHSNLQCTKENYQVISQIIDYWKNQKVWVSNISQLYNWWMIRTHLNARVEDMSENRAFLVVSNSSKYDAEDFFIHVDINKNVNKIKITSDIIGQKLPDQTITEGHKLLLKVHKLASGNSLFYYIDIIK